MRDGYFRHAHLYKRFETAHESLQFAQFRRGRLPRLRSLRQTKAGNQFGVVGLGARQSGIGKGSNGCRVDEADQIIGFKQKQCERLAVSSGCFEASVQIADLMRAEPSDELLEAVPGVGEDFMFSFAVWLNQTDIELRAERSETFLERK